MRTLPNALTDAQRQRSRRPYMDVEIAARFPGIRTMIWDNLYAGAEPDGDHDAAISTDWYITRLHATYAANNLERQRVDLSADPPVWTGWSLWRAATRLCAIAQTGLDLWAFAVDNGTPTRIYMAASTDGRIGLVAA